MSTRQDRLTLLSTFVRIAERGAISAAARDLGMSQASASRQLAELERRLGTTLIHRTTHSLALTEAGSAALLDARQLLGGWDALEERFRAHEHDLTGALKVVAPLALGQLHLTAALLRFQAAHRHLAITWLLDDAPIRFAELGCDLWITIGRPRDETLVARDIAHVERLIVAAPGLTRGLAHPDGLRALPCIALGPFEGATLALTGPDRAQIIIEADVALATNHIFASHQAALAGAGYTVMPRWLVSEDLAAGRLIDVLPTWRAPKLSVTAAYLPARRTTRRLRALLAHLHDAIVAIDGLDEAP